MCKFLLSLYTPDGDIAFLEERDGWKTRHPSGLGEVGFTVVLGSQHHQLSGASVQLWPATLGTGPLHFPGPKSC
jgi:hypothetical protein